MKQFEKKFVVGDYEYHACWEWIEGKVVVFHACKKEGGVWPMPDEFYQSKENLYDREQFNHHLSKSLKVPDYEHHYNIKKMNGLFK